MKVCVSVNGSVFIAAGKMLQDNATRWYKMIYVNYCTRIDETYWAITGNSTIKLLPEVLTRSASPIWQWFSNMTHQEKLE